MLATNRFPNQTIKIAMQIFLIEILNVHHNGILVDPAAPFIQSK